MTGDRAEAPSSTPPQEYWLESHVEDCACGECLAARDAELDHHFTRMGQVI